MYTTKAFYALNKGVTVTFFIKPLDIKITVMKKKNKFK